MTYTVAAAEALPGLRFLTLGTSPQVFALSPDN